MGKAVAGVDQAQAADQAGQLAVAAGQQRGDRTLVEHVHAIEGQAGITPDHPITFALHHAQQRIASPLPHREERLSGKALGMHDVIEHAKSR